MVKLEGEVYSYWAVETAHRFRSQPEIATEYPSLRATDSASALVGCQHNQGCAEGRNVFTVPSDRRYLGTFPSGASLMKHP